MTRLSRPCVIRADETTARANSVVRCGAHYVPGGWVDEFPVRYHTGVANGYDMAQSASDAECGAAATYHLLRQYLKLR